MVDKRNNKTVLFYCPGVDCGGVATAFVQLAKELTLKGWTVKVLLPYKDDYERVAIPTHYIAGWARAKKIKNRLLVRLLNIFNIITRWKFFFVGMPKIDHDVFVVYQMEGFSFWHRYTKKPTIGWFHGMPPREERGWKGALWTRAFSREINLFTKLVGVSEPVSLGWQKRYSIISTPKAIENIVNIDNMLRLGLEPQEEIKKSNIPNIVFLGRISPEKGVFRLLVLLREHLSEGEVFNLFIVGDGPDRVKCESYVQENGLHNVFFLGAKKNPYPYLKASDLLILPSYTEGLPMVLREALLQGCAVLTTNVGGCMAALNGGRWGMVIENKDEEIVKGLKSCLLDKTYSMRDVTGKITHEIRALNDNNRDKVLSLFEEML